LLAKRIGLFDVINVALMAVIVFVTAFPIYYMFVVSISSGTAVMRGDVMFWPKGINFDAYRLVLQDSAILHAYGNTIKYTLIGVTVNLIFTTLCAYPLSRRQLYGRSMLTVLIIFTMFFDGGLIPRYMVVHSLGLVNTIWALFLPTAINVFYMILMRTFFSNIPEEIHESATMDGAGEWRKLVRIVLPLSMPVMATMIIFYSVHHWNSFFPALIYLNDKSLQPLQIILRNIVIDGDMAEQSAEMVTIVAQNFKYAFVIVAITPILAVYPFLQRCFVQGAMLGAVKG